MARGSPPITGKSFYMKINQVCKELFMKIHQIFRKTSLMNIPPYYPKLNLAERDMVVDEK